MADGRLPVQIVSTANTMHSVEGQLIFFLELEKKNAPGRLETAALPSKRPPSVHTFRPEITKHTGEHLGRLQKAAVFYDFVSHLVGDEQ